jgi:hypothetical protein
MHLLSDSPTFKPSIQQVVRHLPATFGLNEPYPFHYGKRHDPCQAMVGEGAPTSAIFGGSRAAMPPCCHNATLGRRRTVQAHRQLGHRLGDDQHHMWLLPSPARARRACPLPGQGEGSRKGERGNQKRTSASGKGTSSRLFEAFSTPRYRLRRRGLG